MKIFVSLTILALGYQSASAGSLLESFGTGDNAFTMEFVTIGNPNNAADTTGSPNPAGSVAYTYNLGKYEVSRGQFDKANVAGSLGIRMADMGPYGGNGLLKPATGISYYEAAKYVNWLNTSTGGTAAYKFVSGTFQLWSPTDAGYDANNMYRNSLAKYVIASSNEWYKGAYGKAVGSWSNFPNGSDSAPTPVAGGTDANTAVYGQSYDTGPADITSAGGLSSYGTMGQGGNVWEWNETAVDGINNTAGENRVLRGGSWYEIDSVNLGASNRFGYSPSTKVYSFGFRVAAVGVPEPSALSLLAIGLSGLAMVRRRK
ncbi:MAG: SUMF1/EgtB/PvdO family nonheme iron enzyme [Aliarcobacter sp.]